MQTRLYSLKYRPNIFLQFDPQSPISGFPGGLEGKASVCNAGHPGSIPELGRSPGEGNSTPLQYSFLENPMDGGAWEAAVHGGHKESYTTERLHFTSRISCTFHPHWTPHSQNILSSFVTPFLLYVASFASCYFTLSTLHALPSRNLHKCWFFSVPIYYIHSTNTVHLTVNSRVCFVTYIYPQWLH